MKSTIKFIGTLETISPVSVCLPDNNGYMPRTSNGKYFIPATSIRGMLRSTAATAIAQVLLMKVDKRLGVDEHYMNFVGVDTGRKVKLGGGYERIGNNIAIRESNPQVSLFGHFSIAGKLKMGNAYCSENDEPLKIYGNGSRNHILNRSPEISAFINSDEIDYVKQIMDADALTAIDSSDLKGEKKKLEAESKKLTGDEKKAVISQINEIDDQIKKIKESRVGSTESILRPLKGFQAIDLGYALEHRMMLTNATEDELQYLLWVLWKASYDFKIGGHQNLGCGEVHASWKITKTSLENPNPIELGTLTIDDDGFKIEGIEFNPSLIENKIINGEFDFTVY
jgi:hypothetical protein